MAQPKQPRMLPRDRASDADIAGTDAVAVEGLLDPIPVSGPVEDSANLPFLPILDLSLLALLLLYWQVGQRIRTEVLGNKCAGYGEQILPTPLAKLVPEYGQGFSERNLARMVRFAEVFPDGAIVSGLSKHLGWSHFVEINL